ncbi:MAG: hypothetical protein FJ029_13425 [Actinobacteria bacterium]|nr:hypothetical protein [Actinomycetota bacterium]
MGTHRLRMTQQFVASVPLATAHGFVADPLNVAPLMPGLDRIEARGPNDYEVIASAQIVTHSALFRINVELTETGPTRLAGRAAGEDATKDTRIELAGSLDLASETPDRTRIAFALEGVVDGDLVLFGSGPAIDFQARHMARQFAHDLRRALESLEGRPM